MYFCFGYDSDVSLSNRVSFLRRFMGLVYVIIFQLFFFRYYFFDFLKVGGYFFRRMCNLFGCQLKLGK